MPSVSGLLRSIVRRSDARTTVDDSADVDRSSSPRVSSNGGRPSSIPPEEEEKRSVDLAGGKWGRGVGPALSSKPLSATTTKRRISKHALEGRRRAATECSQKYKLGAIIGLGGDAKVRLATRKSDGAKFAVKVLDRERASFATDNARGGLEGWNNGLLSAEEMKTRRNARVEREVWIHSRLLHHAHLVACFDAYAPPGAAEAHLVLEHCAGGTLLDQIAQDEASGELLLSESGAAHIAKQVLEAIAFIHSHGVVHRDIKLENLLLRDVVTPGTKTVHVKLCDFGCARHAVLDPAPEEEPPPIVHTKSPRQIAPDLSDQPTFRADFAKAGRAATMHVGTLQYMAPEQLLGGTLDSALDIWSFGIVLCGLCTGSHPLRDVDQSDWLDEMRRNRLPDGVTRDAEELWATLPRARDLTAQLLRCEPSERLTAEKALLHPWIAEKKQHLAVLEEHDRSSQKKLAAAASEQNNIMPPPGGTQQVRRLLETSKSVSAKGMRPDYTLLKSKKQQERSSVDTDADSEEQLPEIFAVKKTSPAKLSEIFRKKKSKSSILTKAMGKLQIPFRKIKRANSERTPSMSLLVPRPSASLLDADTRSSGDGDGMRLPAVLRGLREVQRTRLQKLLHIFVAFKSSDEEVKKALELFERLIQRRSSGAPSSRSYLVREDVEEALLCDDSVSLRVADELCETFEELSLNGNGRVSISEFVAGAFSTRRRNQAEVTANVLRPLQGADGRISAKALASALASLRLEEEVAGDIGARVTEDGARMIRLDSTPGEAEIARWIARLDPSAEGSLSTDEVLKLLLDDSEDPEEEPSVVEQPSVERVSYALSPLAAAQAIGLPPIAAAQAAPIAVATAGPTYITAGPAAAGPTIQFER